MSDSPEEQLFFWVVMLFSWGLQSCPKAQRWCFASALGFQGQEAPVSERLWAAAQVPPGCFLSWLFIHKGDRWIVFPVRCDSPESKERPGGAVTSARQAFAPPSLAFLHPPLSLSSSLTCLQRSISFQHWVGWFALLKSRKNKADFFFFFLAAGKTKPLCEKIHSYQCDSLWLVRRERSTESLLGAACP